MTTHSIAPSAGRGLTSSFERYLTIGALGCSALFPPGATAAQSNQPPAVASVAAADTAPTRLEQARAALTGQNKEPERAKKLLLEIVESGTQRTMLGPSELSYAYVYLGYIADRAGQRDEALSWYKRALELEQGDRGIQQCAADGLKGPLTWIRHLDPNTSPPSLNSTPPPPEKGYVTTQNFPKGMVPAKELSAQQRQENFEFLCEAIDKTYACFELKHIDWAEVCQRYQGQLGQTKTAYDFYGLLFQLVGELKDTHSWLQNFHMELPSSGPGLTVEFFEGRPFVVAVKPGSEAANAGIAPGAEILKIDGQTVQERMDALRKQLPGRSTQRAFQREATRYLLTGDKGTTVSISLRSPGA